MDCSGVIVEKFMKFLTADDTKKDEMVSTLFASGDFKKFVPLICIFLKEKFYGDSEEIWVKESTIIPLKIS